VSSSTGDIWDLSDNCRFVYQNVTGDFDFRARVQSLTGSAYWAKAGVMLRHSVQGTAGEFSVLATRASGVGYYVSMSRLLTGYYTDAPFASAVAAGRVAYPNSWVRLARVGKQAVAQHSSNGVDWAQIGVETLYEAVGPALVGLAVSTHTDAIGSKTTAQFRGIELRRSQIGAPVVVTQPESRIVNPGASLTLNVTAKGQSPLAYQWFRNSEAIAGATSSSIHLDNLLPSKAGKYFCFVTNSLGTLSSWVAAIEVVLPRQPFDGILYERFASAQGLQFDYVVNLARYPNEPIASIYRPMAELPSNVADNYGARLSGYVLAPQSGLYTFWIAADDNGTLWISSDDNPANKRLIAECPYWVNPREWNYFTTQQSVSIYLEAGRRYYLEAQFKEADVIDHGAIGWQLPDGKLERPIPSTRFRGDRAVLKAEPGFADRVSLIGTENSLYILSQSSNLFDWTPVITDRSPFQIDSLIPKSDQALFFRATTQR